MVKNLVFYYTVTCIYIFPLGMLHGYYLSLVEKLKLTVMNLEHIVLDNTVLQHFTNICPWTLEPTSL